MPQKVDQRAGEERAGSWGATSRVLAGVVALLAVMHLPLVFRLQISSDEFQYLGLIHAFRRGDLILALQTFQVRFLGWIGAWSGDEIEQVTVGRGLSYLMLLGSCTLIYRIGRTFLSRPASLFAVLCMLAYSEVLMHGTSFRADGLALLLLLGALALLLRRSASSGSVSCAGVLTAVAGLVTIKSVFYVPTLLMAAVLAEPHKQPRRILARTALFVASALVAFAVIYALHRWPLSLGRGRGSVELVENAVERVIRFDDPIPALGFLLRSMFANAGTWLFLLLGTALLVPRAVRGEKEAILLLALLAPMGSLLIYANAYPYYYLFIMPPALLVAAVPLDRLSARPGPARAALIAVMVLGALLGTGVYYPWLMRENRSAQERVIRAVHQMFPEPVPYIDGWNAISTFPKLGFFMSTWGFANYRAGEPIFGSILQRGRPVFVLANHPALDLDRESRTGGSPVLFDEDVEILRENYVHYWGPVYVAGKRLSASDTVETEILIPGHYTVAAAAPVRLNGTAYQPGQTVQLPEGRLRMSAAAPGDTVVLSWDHELQQPPFPPPEGVLFREFYPCGALFSRC